MRLHIKKIPAKRSVKRSGLATSGVHFFRLGCVCVFIASSVRVGTLLMEVPGTPTFCFCFFQFKLKPTGKDSADPTQKTLMQIMSARGLSKFFEVIFIFGIIFIFGLSSFLMHQHF